MLGAIGRGLSKRRVLFVHVLRNGAGTVVTILGMRVPTLLGGAVVTESIFGMAAEALAFGAPEGLIARGTVVVIPGGGDSPASYRRLGARLAADAYEVRVIASPDADVDAYARAVKDALTDVDTRPVVVLGSDVGALVASVLVRRQAVSADALVLAALPRQARVRHVVVDGAHHDVLNDLQHRSVAAAVVTFLERLRQPEPAADIVRIAHSAWAVSGKDRRARDTRIPPGRGPVRHP